MKTSRIMITGAAVLALVTGGTAAAAAVAGPIDSSNPLSSTRKCRSEAWF